MFGFVRNHLVVGIIDQIAYEEEQPSGEQPMDAFVTVTRKRELVLSDVKTRVNLSLPSARQTRAAEIQLSLYHIMLSAMIDGTVDTEQLYTGLSLDADTPFTDGFLAEAGQSYSVAGVIAFDDLVENNTLNVKNLLEVLMAEIMGTRVKRVIPVAQFANR